MGDKIMKIRVPLLPESVADAVVAAWLKQEGDFVEAEEALLELETDKVVLEVTAPKSGRLIDIIAQKDAVVIANQVLALLDETQSVTQLKEHKENQQSRHEPPMSPAVRQSLAKQKLDYYEVMGTGKKGRILKTDVVDHQTTQASKNTDTVPKMSTLSKSETITTKTTMTPNTAIGNNKSSATTPLPQANGISNTDIRPEKRVPMTRLRQRIAERLVHAQQNAAILTTFNEVDLGEIKRMRHRYQSRFQDKHGIKLGFMSFFAKAATEALKRFPEVNASIEGNEIVYHGYYDIGVAVSTERGLVVPVIKNIDQLSYAQIEQKIIDYAVRARNNHLDIEELTGGTFSISNGGVFGSMLSTPILNPPQSAILGMHKIEERPIAVQGEVVVRPMMYLALSYDHRLIDGKTAVSFLIKIKELLEDPASLLLEL